jgi:hypothetical protein
VEEVGRFLVGALLSAFVAWVLAGATFRLRHWRDWPTRWRDAHPAIAVFLAWDLYGRTIFRDRDMPRSSVEAFLWEMPILLIACLTLIGGVLLVFGLIGPS